jgi:FkbM family methyltransferase
MSEILQQELTRPTFAKGLIRYCVPRRVRNWLRTPSNTAKWVWDEIKFLSGIRPIVQMRAGWVLTCHPAAYRCAYYLQVDDPDQVAEFNGFVHNSSQGMVLFDIGAHFGLFSLAALHYGGNRATAIAVDPSPVAARFLKVQAELNDVTHRLRIVQASVGEQTGRQSMVPVGVLANGFYVAPTFEHPESEQVQTKAITLDDLADEVKLWPTHIKIDVEGGEASVLRGAKRLLTREPAPTLFIELHNEILSLRGDRPAETLLLLRSFGYAIFDVSGRVIEDDVILSKPLIRVIAKKDPGIASKQIKLS